MVADVRSVGSISSGTGTASGVGLPTGWQINDVILIVLEHDTGTVSAPAGWAHVTGSPVVQTNGSATTLSVLWKRATSGQTFPTITNPGWDHWIARTLAIKDCPLTGDPWDLTASGTEDTADTSVSFPTGGTPTGSNTLWVYALAMGTAQGANNTTRFTGAFSNSGLTALTERVDNGRTDGNDGVLGVWSGRRLQSTNPGATTGTSADSDTKAMLTMAFKTAPAADLPFDSLAQNGSSTTDTTVYTTAGSMNPEANNRMVAYILGTGTAVAAPTLSGLGLTWGSPVEVEEVPDASTTQKLWVYVADGVASPTIGTVSITFGATVTGCSWHFERMRGAASATPVQQPKASTTTTPANLSLTWSARTGTKFRLFGYAVSPQSTGNTVTPETNWDEESEIVRATPNIKLGVWREFGAADDSTTIADDSSYDYCAIGLEFDFAAGTTETLDGDLAGSASLTGSLTADATLDGSATTTATLSGAVTADAPVGGDLAASAALSGSLTADTPIAGDSTTTVALTGAAARDANGSGDLVATASLSGAAARDAAASGTVTVTAGLTGEVTADTPVSGSTTTTANLTGGVTAEKTLTGDLAGLWGTDGVLGVSRPTSGTLDVSAGLTGAATVDRQTFGDMTATATLSGDLEVLGSEDFGGHLTTDMALAGALTGDRAATGDLTTTASISGDLTADTAVSGTLTATASLTGTASRDATASGDVAGVFVASGSLEVTKPLTGDLADVFAATGDMSEGDPPVLLGGDLDALWDASGDATADKPTAGDLAGVAGFSGGLETVRNHTGNLVSTVVLTGGLSVGKTLTGTLTVTADLDGAVTDAVEATYTPGEPYMLTTPGPPYVETGVFGWGQGGWGEGPWGGD